ncbi:hypothetical protein KWF60_15765 [Acinetobacter baumannii]
MVLAIYYFPLFRFCVSALYHSSSLILDGSRTAGAFAWTGFIGGGAFETGGALFGDLVPMYWPIFKIACAGDIRL